MCLRVRSKIPLTDSGTPSTSVFCSPYWKPLFMTSSSVMANGLVACMPEDLLYSQGI